MAVEYPDYDDFSLAIFTYESHEINIISDVSDEDSDNLIGLLDCACLLADQNKGNKYTLNVEQKRLNCIDNNCRNISKLFKHYDSICPTIRIGV